MREYQLLCEGTCGSRVHTAHEFDHAALVKVRVNAQVDAEQDAKAQMFRCKGCGHVRRYGVES